MTEYLEFSLNKTHIRVRDANVNLPKKFVDNQQKTEKWCKDVDEVLEYMIDGERLRDIITKVEVTDRTI